MDKNKSGRKQVTPWVAILIITAVASFFVYFIWAGANESWASDSVYPTFNLHINKFLTSIETVNWKTHTDDGYGFTLKHPVKYSGTITEIAPNSILGIAGASIGPLVFVKLDTTALKNAGNTKFNYYWNYKGINESPKDYCTKGIIPSSKVDIRIVFCVMGSKKSNYAYIKGPKFDMFIDGATNGYDKLLINAYGPAGTAVSQAEFIQILSTFEFLSDKKV